VGRPAPSASGWRQEFTAIPAGLGGEVQGGPVWPGQGARRGCLIAAVADARLGPLPANGRARGRMDSPSAHLQRMVVPEAGSGAAIGRGRSF